VKLPEPFTFVVEARIFIESLSRIRRVLRRFEVPIAASLSAGGSIRVLLAAGEWLQPPKEFK
jgi:hypothetical protein